MEHIVFAKQKIWIGKYSVMSSSSMFGGKTKFNPNLWLEKSLKNILKKSLLSSQSMKSKWQSWCLLAFANWLIVIGNVWIL